MKRLAVSRTAVTDALYGRAGRLLALRDAGYWYHVFDLTTYSLVRSIQSTGPETAALCLAFFPNGGAAAERLGLWPAGEELPAGGDWDDIRQRLGLIGWWTFHFHPDGRRAVVRYGAEPEFQTAGGERLATFVGQSLGGRFELTDLVGDRVAIGGTYPCSRLVRLYDTAGGEARRVLACGDDVRRVRFAPGGAFLGVAAGRAVYLFDEDGALAHRFRAFRKGVTALAWSPDGRLLLAGSGEGRVRVWEAATGRELADLDWGGGAVHCLAVAPDGATAVAGCRDGSAVVWDLDP